MSEKIFGEVAPRYWAAGMSVIPLLYHEKKPAIGGWSRFWDQLPSEEEQQDWLSRYPHYNVGLVCGQQSGVTMIDIDTTNEELTRIILACLPPSPWKRVGKKGMVLAYRDIGLPTFRIKDVHGQTLVEHLGARTQVVLPPSIHPETLRPYEATADLVAVKDDLMPLPREIEAMLRGALKTEGGIELSHKGWSKVTDWVSVGSRDVKMTSMAGLFAYGVIRGERPLKEAIEMLRSWASERTEKVAGDDIDIDKGIQNLIRFLARDVIEKKKVLPVGWDEGLTEEDKAKLGLNFQDEHQEMSYEQLKEYLLGQFEIHPVESVGRTTAVNYALEKIARSPKMNRLDSDRLLKYISEASGMRVTMASLRARVRELAAGELAGNDHTEIARAVIKDREQYGPLRYHLSNFWTWAGSHWEVVPDEDLKRDIAQNYGSLPAAKKAHDHRGILTTMANLVDHYLGTSDMKGVNFANGFLTQGMKLLPHNPDFGCTYTLPYRYMPELSGKAFRFEQFLMRIWGKERDFEERRAALQEAICATLFGMGPKLQKAILLLGPGKTGKTTLLQIVSSLMPDGARSYCPPHEWGDKFAPATMREKLINICGELSENKLIDGSRFKDIVDGNEIQGQFKGQQLFNFKPVCTHWFASNHTPKTLDTSDGFTRRWLVFTFNDPLKQDEVRLDFADQLVAEEREAIAAWAVEAMPRLAERNRYTDPPSHIAAMEEIAEDINSVRFFIQASGLVKVERVTDGERTSPPTSEAKLWNAYYSFCLSQVGAKPVGLRMFKKRMKDIAIEQGFKVIIRHTEAGTPETFYDGLILVGAAAK